MVERALSSVEVLIAIVAYMTCSSVALVANKVVMFYMKAPGFVFCLQLLATVFFIFSTSALSLIDVDKITLPNVRAFLPYIASFVLCLYSNGKALEASNIETVIVFRACTPLFVSVLDFIFLGREFPSLRSLAALVGVVVGAVLYVQADGEFALQGFRAYKWVTINLCGIVFEMVYGKALISGIQFKNPVWGATMYTNLLALAPMALLASGEVPGLMQLSLSMVGATWLIMSCFIGIGISWATWNCRNKTSATVFTLLGVVCKFMSVLLNIMLWDKHASNRGLMALSLCLLSSSMYRQAPKRMRDPASPKVPSQEKIQMAEKLEVVTEESAAEKV
mmetsp:Transcript_46844/g.111473  ORF Transcript_46844/g.111473 Transcript_46844/m.111473 type:complete len:335 (+) Transcript_46844:113-1117(+)